MNCLVVNESSITKLQGLKLHGLMDRFFTLSWPNIRNLMLTLKMGMLNKANWTTFFNFLKIAFMVTSKMVSSLDKIHQRFICSNYSPKVRGVGSTLLHICNQGGVCKEHG